MHPLKLLEAMAARGSTARERPQAQMLPYSAEASAQRCPAAPLSSECDFQHCKCVM